METETTRQTSDHTSHEARMQQPSHTDSRADRVGARVERTWRRLLPQSLRGAGSGHTTTEESVTVSMAVWEQWDEQRCMRRWTVVREWCVVAH